MLLLPAFADRQSLDVLDRLGILETAGVAQDAADAGFRDGALPGQGRVLPAHRGQCACGRRRVLHDQQGPDPVTGRRIRLRKIAHLAGTDGTAAQGRALHGHGAHLNPRNLIHGE